MFPTIIWKVLSSEEEPQNIEETYITLFPRDSTEFTDHIRDPKALYYFSNKLFYSDITQLEVRTEKLISMTCYAVSLLVARKEYALAQKLLD
jgi:hypothetical protein